MGAFPSLSTDRLELRELRLDDAADVLVFRGDPVVQRFDDPPIATVAEAEAFIGEMLAASAAGRQQIWAITLRGEGRVIGLVGLYQHGGDHYHRRGEIGYGIARACWGRGIGGEAVGAVLRHAFAGLGLHRVYARTIADNHESVRMLERLGFTREGSLREHSLEDDGLFHDSAQYGLLAREWRA